MARITSDCCRIAEPEPLDRKLGGSVLTALAGLGRVRACSVLSAQGH